MTKNKCRARKSSNQSRRRNGQDKKGRSDGNKEWEAARRHRFNAVLEALRRELPDCGPCPKVEVIQSAISYIQESKAQRESLLSGNGAQELKHEIRRLVKLVTVVKQRNAVLVKLLQETGLRFEANDGAGELVYTIPGTCVQNNCSNATVKKLKYGQGTCVDIKDLPPHCWEEDEDDTQIECPPDPADKDIKPPLDAPSRVASRDYKRIAPSTCSHRTQRITTRLCKGSSDIRNNSSSSSSSSDIRNNSSSSSSSSSDIRNNSSSSSSSSSDNRNNSSSSSSSSDIRSNSSSSSSSSNNVDTGRKKLAPLAVRPSTEAVFNSAVIGQENTVVNLPLINTKEEAVTALPQTSESAHVTGNSVNPVRVLSGSEKEASSEGCERERLEALPETVHEAEQERRDQSPKEKIIVEGVDRDGTVTVSIVEEDEAKTACSSPKQVKTGTARASKVPDAVKENVFTASKTCVRVQDLPSLALQSGGPRQGVSQLPLQPSNAFNSPSQMVTLQVQGEETNTKGQKVLLVQCGNPGPGTIQLVSPLTDASQRTYVTSSLPGVPIMSTGGPPPLIQGRKIMKMVNSSPFFLLPRQPIMTPLAPVAKLKPIAPKPCACKPVTSSPSYPVVSVATPSKTQLSPVKKEASHIATKTPTKPKRLLEKPDDKPIKRSKVSFEQDVATASKLSSTLQQQQQQPPPLPQSPPPPALHTPQKGITMSQVEIDDEQGQDLQEISTSALTGLVHSAGIMDCVEEDALGNIMDIRVVDMPCVMAENMRGAAMDTTTSADDRLVEMLRSIDESDPQSCDFSPPSSPSVVDSESFVKPGKLSEQQEATEVPQAESHSHSNSHNNKVTPEAPIQEATQTTSSPALKQRVNIEGVVSSRGPTETSLNNTSYSITSLCLSSRPPEDIDTPIQDIHDIHSHSSTSYLSELPDGLPEVASSLTASIASSMQARVSTPLILSNSVYSSLSSPLLSRDHLPKASSAPVTLSPPSFLSPSLFPQPPSSLPFNTHSLALSVPPITLPQLAFSSEQHPPFTPFASTTTTAATTTTTTTTTTNNITTSAVAIPVTSITTTTTANCISTSSSTPAISTPSSFSISCSSSSASLRASTSSSLPSSTSSSSSSPSSSSTISTSSSSFPSKPLSHMAIDSLVHSSSTSASSSTAPLTTTSTSHDTNPLPNLFMNSTVVSNTPVLQRPSLASLPLSSPATMLLPPSVSVTLSPITTSHLLPLSTTISQTLAQKVQQSGSSSLLPSAPLSLPSLPPPRSYTAASTFSASLSSSKNAPLSLASSSLPSLSLSSTVAPVLPHNIESSMSSSSAMLVSSPLSLSSSYSKSRPSYQIASPSSTFSFSLTAPSTTSTVTTSSSSTSLSSSTSIATSTSTSTTTFSSGQSSVAPATSCASLFFSAPSNMSLSTSFLQSLQSISSTSTCAPSPLSVDGLSALPGCASLPGPLFTCAPSTFTSLMMPVTQTSLMPTLPTEPYSGIGFEGLSLASPVFATLGAKMHEVGKSDTMGVASSSLLHFPDVPISSCDPVTNFTPSVGASMLPLLPQMRSGLGEMEDDRAKNCHKKRDSVSCLGVADSLLLSAPSLIATPATLGTPLPTPKSSAETPATICKAQNQKPFTSVTPRVESSKSFSTKDEAVVIPAAAAASQKPKPALSLAREEKDLLSTPCQNTDLKFSHKVSAHAYTTANPKAVAESVKASGRVQEERAEGRRETQHKEHSLSHEIEAEQKNMESKSKDQTKISSPVLKTEESHSFMLDLTEHPRERKAEQSQENVSQDRRHSKHKEKAFTKEISDADAPQQPKIEKGRSLCSEIPSVMGSSPKADKQNHQKAAEVDETQAAGTSQGVLARHHGGSGTQSDLPALSHPIHVTPSAAVMSKVKDDIAVVASSGMPSQCGDEELLASIAEQELNGQVGGSSMQHSHSGKHEHDTVSSADQYKLTPPLKHLPMQQQQIQKQQQHHQHQQHLQPQPQQEQQKQLQHLQQQQQKPSQHQQQQLQQPQQQQKPPTSQQQLQKQHHHHQQHQQQQQQQQQPKESGGIQNSPASGQNVTSHQVPKYQINHTQVQQQQLQPQQQLHQQHHQQHQQQHHHQPQHPQHVGHHRTPQSHATVSHSQSHINQTPLHKHQQQPTTQQLATQQNPLVQQQPQQITDHSLLTHSSNLVSGITGGLVGEVSTVLGDKGAASQVMQPAQQPGMGLTVPYHPPVVTAPSYMQPPTYDYNTYCRKAPNSPRSEARHQCYGYTGKQHHYQHAEILAPDPNMVTHNTPMLMPGSFLETPEDPTPMRPEPSSEHVRYFSVSHLVNSSEPRKTSVSGQKDNTVAAQPEEKSKELSRSKPGTRKSESKSRTSAGNKNSSQAESHSRRRSPARGSQQSNSGSVPGVMWGNSNSNKSSSAHKQGHNYSTEALLSSQNYSRGTHRSPANQNYTIMTPNQMYQSNYTPQQMKNYVPNTSFGYTSHDRSGQSSCNTDYNFQLHAQPSGSLTYGGNMAYMPTGYPYQNLPSSSTSMLSGDIMAPPHPTGPYPRFPDFPADQSNFPPNPTFPLSLDPQDVCSGGGLMGATSGAMATRAPHTDMQLAPASSVSSSVAYSRSTSNRSSGNGTTTTNLQVGSNHSGANKRSRYGDTNMVGGSMGGAANLLEGGALSHISLHSFTPPCDDPSLVHSNLFPTTAPRHQGNFLLGTDNLMPINTPQYPSSSSSGTAGGSGTATHLGVGGVTGVPGTRSGSSVVLPPGAPGHVPFSPIRMMDRQQVNMAPPPVAPHLSSSLSNFNLTSIIPEIDGKSGESNTGMGSSSSRNVTSNEVVSAASLSSQARLPPMPSSLLPPAESLKSLPSDTNRLPPAMLNNSMNNIFTHTPHHQMGLGLNSSLPLPPTTFSGINFPATDH